MRATALAAALAAASVAGCDPSNSPTALQRGRAIFVKSCASCHTLTGREHGAAGGDLALGNLTVANIISFARVMPIRPPLSPAETEAVARYVYLAQRRHGR